MNAAQSLQSAVYRLRHAVVPDSAALTEPSTALFQAIRWRLALWYSSVLAVVLLAAGVLLYVVVRQSLLNPIQRDLHTYAQLAAVAWQSEVTSSPSPVLLNVCDLEHVDPGLRGEYFACYDPHGKLLGASRGMSQVLLNASPDFIDSSLVNRALQSGHAEDIVDSGTYLDTTERYASQVVLPNGHVIGVIQTVWPIGSELSTLATLLQVLVIIGVATVVVSIVTGLFLANRALLPARLAYARQRHFIADASHELRTPLTIVRADAEVLLRDRDRFSPDDVAILEDVVSETGHMTNLANNMLNLARLEAGGIQIEQDVVDLSSIAREIARRMGPLAAEQDITLRFEDGEPVLVVGDAVQLEQVALALVDNAIKYNHPGGEVFLRTWVEGQRAHLEVRDTGIGIAPEHLPRLGERFYRVDKARSREIGGAGLGISIVRTIAARHGGSLRYASEPGKGTTATLTLPSADKVVARAMP